MLGTGVAKHVTHMEMRDERVTVPKVPVRGEVLIYGVGSTGAVAGFG
jgi:hypothetical protein